MSEVRQEPGRSHRHRYEGPFFRRLFLGGVKWMPRLVQRLSMPLWAGIFYLLVGSARRGVERNLDRVLGPASVLRRRWRSFELFWNYAQMITDSYAVHMDLGLPVAVETTGRDHLLTALQRGQGVIAITGHLGMWQIGGFMAEFKELAPFCMAMAAEPNPEVQAFEERFRSRFQIVYTTDSPFSSLPLASALRHGSIVGMQMDRHLGGQTVAVPFCGALAHFSVGPAMLARATGAPLVPIFFVVDTAPLRLRRRLRHCIEAPIEVPRTADRDADVAEATARLAQVLERYVKQYPTQWYNFHDFWGVPEQKARPAGALPVAAAVRSRPASAPGERGA